jgi:acetate---CoA ligase (ADP-forming)
MESVVARTADDADGQAPPAGRRSYGPLVTPGRLGEFFTPRSIAVVGASDTSGWTRFIVESSVVAGFTGPLIPVHPRHPLVFGQPTVPSLRDLNEPVDLAFILVPTQAVQTVLDDAGAAGIRNVIVLASGFREAGAAGLALEDRLAASAASRGITMLGPNCLGFLHAHARAAPFALRVPPPLRPGPVGIALQSGALASVVLAFARARAIGVSLLATLGNEAMIGINDVLRYLVADADTRVVCLFLEEIRDFEDFARVADSASQAGKPIVALKVGSSPAGQQAALAHTGSVAGDHAVASAALRQLNIIQVSSIEELLCTGAVLGYYRWPRGRRMGVVTASGGACDIIADRATAQGIEIPQFDAQTVAAITPHVPPFAAVRNPLDVTGYVLANQRTSALTPVDYALDAAVTDPGLDFVLFSGVTIPDVRPADKVTAAVIEERTAWLTRCTASAPIPVIPIGSTCVDVAGYAREVLDRHGVHLLGGIEIGLAALGNALRWLERREQPRPARHRRVPAYRAGSGGPWPETRARELLMAFGIPLVPAELARSADEAVLAARRIGVPAALKICSAQIPHKSDVGGVALGLGTDAEIRAAYQRVRAAGRRVPGALIEGVLVTAMRTTGVELLAGVTVDPSFGPVLAVGLGGIWVEVLADTALHLLPVGPPEVKRMLGELKGAPLLRGARGGPAADLDVLAEVITRVTDAAASLGSALRALEINPLWVNGAQVEALDVLVVTEPGGTSGTESPR